MPERFDTAACAVSVSGHAGKRPHSARVTGTHWYLAGEEEKGQGGRCAGSPALPRRASEEGGKQEVASGCCARSTQLPACMPSPVHWQEEEDRGDGRLGRPEEEVGLAWALGKVLCSFSSLFFLLFVCPIKINS